MNKRVHEIAKERGVPTKEVLAKLKAAGIEVKAASSSVDEAVALRALGNGDSAQPAQPAPAPEKAEKPAAAAPQQAAPQPPSAPAADGDQPRQPSPGAERPAPRPDQHKRPTRDSLQGERAPGSSQGRRRVVID